MRSLLCVDDCAGAIHESVIDIPVIMDLKQPQPFIHVLRAWEFSYASKLPNWPDNKERGLHFIQKYILTWIFRYTIRLVCCIERWNEFDQRAAYSCDCKIAYIRWTIDIESKVCLWFLCYLIKTLCINGDCRLLKYPEKALKALTFASFVCEREKNEKPHHT